MEAIIIVPSEYAFIFKVAVEDANGGKIIATKDSDVTVTVTENGNKQSFLLCKIEYKSPQSLFDTGIDFALGIVSKKDKNKNKINQ